MRKSCLECVAKHLGSAAVYIEECELGYPNYYGYAYGELAHASSECRKDYPELSWAIREHRIKWSRTKDSDAPHRIPFEAMFSYISVLSALEVVEDKGEKVKIPEEVLEGLDKNENGIVVYSMDTRP